MDGFKIFLRQACGSFGDPAFIGQSAEYNEGVVANPDPGPAPKTL
jgi:hypothetical protein